MSALKDLANSHSEPAASSALSYAGTEAITQCLLVGTGNDNAIHTSLTSLTDSTGRLVLDGCLVLEGFSGLLISGKSCLGTKVSAEADE